MMHGSLYLTWKNEKEKEKRKKKKEKNSKKEKHQKENNWEKLWQNRY